MVKSRRAASSSQSSVKATTAWRPSVSRSRLRLVTSNGWPFTIAVMVPCSNPVGTVLIPALSSRRSVSSGGMGTAISTSSTGQPRSPLRTAPPTKRPSLSAASTVRVSGAVIQGCRAGSIFMAPLYTRTRQPGREIHQDRGGGAPDGASLRCENIEAAFAPAPYPRSLTSVGGIEKEGQWRLKHFRHFVGTGHHGEAVGQHAHNRRDVEAGAGAIARQITRHADKAGVDPGLLLGFAQGGL